MSNVSISFEYAGQIVKDTVTIPGFTPSDINHVESMTFRVKHNSNYAIRDCGFYISPKPGKYEGTLNNVLDYEKVLWFGNNFYESDANKVPYGFSIKQNYTVKGIVTKASTLIIADTNRKEQVDIFSPDGSRRSAVLEITTGISAGEKREIIGYDLDKAEFTISGAFTSIAVGDEYQVTISSLDTIKSQVGSSEDYLIPLLYNGGVIERSAVATFTLMARFPESLKEAGIHYYDLNLKYIPEE